MPTQNGSASKAGAASNIAPKATTDEVALINQELYKRNAELAFRNKTLALLRKLYEITIATLDVEDLARQIASTIREDLQLELASIYVLDNKKTSLLPLAYATSNTPGASSTYQPRSIPLTDTSNPRIRALFNNEVLELNDPTELWDETKLRQISGNIITVLVYPLVTESKELGVFVLALNRRLDDLPQYEREILGNLQNVVSVAIDKALIYEELTVTNKSLQKATGELRNANTELKRLDEAKSEFLSIASHQLLTPLTPIQGYASMLEDGDFGKISPEQRKVIGEMHQSAVRLVRLVDDLLNISRIESGRVHYEFGSHQLEDLVDSLVDELQIKAAQKKVTLTYHTPSKPHRSATSAWANASSKASS